MSVRYQVIDGGYLDRETNELIFDAPTDERRQRVLDWMAAGNAPDPLPEVPIPQPTIAMVRATTNAAVEAEWLRREGLGFTFNGKLIQTDDRSLMRITAAAASAQIATMTSQPFAIEWKCADNTMLQLDAAGMMGLLAAMTRAGYLLFQYAQTLKDQLAAAADPLSIDVMAGWPSV